MVTQKVIVESRKVRKNGLAPLCLRITKNRRHVYRTLNYIKPKYWDFDKERVKKEHPNSTKLNLKIMSIKSKVQEISLDLEAKGSFFNAKMIKEILIDENHDNFIKYSENWIEERFQSKVITYSSKIKYKGVIEKLKNYSKGNLLISEFTVEYIKKYERYLISYHKNSRNTISSNFSCLRAISNSLLDEGKIKHDDYPFRKIKLKYEDSQREFLPPEDIQKLWTVKIKEGTKIKSSQDIFLFCLETGFRIGDALLLEQADLRNNQLFYFSQKTKDYQIMPLTTRAQAIVNNYISKNKGKTKYVFDFLEESKMKDDRSSLNEQKRKTALINKNLNIIGKRAGVATHISSHLARHSFATNALSKGLSYAEIQSLLNHSDVKTTQIYAKTHDRMKMLAINKLN